MAVCGFYGCAFYKDGLCSDPEPSNTEYCKGTAKVKAPPDLKEIITMEKKDLYSYFTQQHLSEVFWPDGEVDTEEAFIVYISNGPDAARLMQHERREDGYINYDTLRWVSLALLDELVARYPTLDVLKTRNYFCDDLENDIWDLYQNYMGYWIYVIRQFAELLHTSCSEDVKRHWVNTTASEFANLCLWRTFKFGFEEV